MPHLQQGQRVPTCGRDMTQPELNLLFSIRKQCYLANQEVGLMKYYVRDLEIAELKQPRALIPAASTSQGST